MERRLVLVVGLLIVFVTARTGVSGSVKSCV